ncbi:MAG: class I SAM-dependent methyltransferase [Geobacter sp.]|nr:MAG: class I SAM-dependent methyltransferase [Geobacter sp.]
MERDRLKWNSRYAADGFFIGPHPSRYLAEQIDLIESLVPGKKALDIACGEGRNSIFLARRGFCVTGIDISDEGLDKAARRSAEEGVEITFLREDLESWEFSGSWDLILNLNFLLRDLIPKIISALNPGGIVLFETLLDSPLLPGVHTPAFLLQPGELVQLFARFAGVVRHHEERTGADSATARLIFQKDAGRTG